MEEQYATVEPPHILPNQTTCTTFLCTEKGKSTAFFFKLTAKLFIVARVQKATAGTVGNAAENSEKENIAAYGDVCKTESSPFCRTDPPEKSTPLFMNGWFLYKRNRPTDQHWRSLCSTKNARSSNYNTAHWFTYACIILCPPTHTGSLQTESLSSDSESLKLLVSSIPQTTPCNMELSPLFVTLV